jgi:uncharacterized membrane protein
MPGDALSSLPAAKALRMAPLDWMRGIVMVLMAIDHSSDEFNAGRLFTDAFFMYTPGTPLPVAQFLTRFITHLCAPTFVFLAGTGLAFTVNSQIARGVRASVIDRQLATRGVVIALFELWISWLVMPPKTWLFQVLYAIGVSFLCMIALRRLSNAAALGLGLLLIAGGEALLGICVGEDPANAPLLLQLLLVPGERPSLFIAYPAIHWLAMMLLGWAWGRSLIQNKPAPEQIARQLAAWGVGSLVVFAIVRGLNGYGNMLLYREGHSLVQWLHVSKYPPSLSYTLLELGIMALIMAALFQFSRGRIARPSGLFLVLGQTPMFFYLLHFPLLVLAATVSGTKHQLGLLETYLAAAAVVLILYPACRWYRPVKASGRYAVTRYI